MIGLLALMLLRPLLRPLVGLAAHVLAALLLTVAAELLAERLVDPDMPRWVALALAAILTGAWRFWRRRLRRCRAAAAGCAPHSECR